jgi:hypothetical protein
MPLPKILVQVHESGLVKVRSSFAARIAVVNMPRLKKLAEIDPTNIAARIISATRFMRRTPVEATELITTRDQRVRDLGVSAPETLSAPRTEYEVPVTQKVRVEATSLEEARRLALEELGLEADEATVGDPTPTVIRAEASI